MATWTSSRAKWIAAWEQDDGSSPAAQRSRARIAARNGGTKRGSLSGTSSFIPAELAPAAARARRATGSGAVAYALEESTLPEPDSLVAPLPRRAQTRATIRVAPNKRMRWVLMLASSVFLLTLFSSLILGPLALNSVSTKADWRLAQLQQKEEGLKASIATLSARAATLSSTQEVAAQATQLGLTPASRVEYVSLDTVKAAGVAGVPVSVEGGSSTNTP